MFVYGCVSLCVAGESGRGAEVAEIRNRAALSLIQRLYATNTPTRSPIIIIRARRIDHTSTVYDQNLEATYSPHRPASPPPSSSHSMAGSIASMAAARHLASFSYLLEARRRSWRKFPSCGGYYTVICIFAHTKHRTQQPAPPTSLPPPHMCRSTCGGLDP